MKRTVVLLRPYAGAGSVLLMLSLFFLAGCSGSGDDGDGGAKSRQRVRPRTIGVYCAQEGKQESQGLQESASETEN